MEDTLKNAVRALAVNIGKDESRARFSLDDQIVIGPNDSAHIDQDLLQHSGLRMMTTPLIQDCRWLGNRRRLELADMQEQDAERAYPWKVLIQPLKKCIEQG